MSTPPPGSGSEGPAPLRPPLASGPEDPTPLRPPLASGSEGPAPLRPPPGSGSEGPAPLRPPLASGPGGADALRPLLATVLDALDAGAQARGGPLPPGGPDAVAARLSAAVGDVLPEHGDPHALPTLVRALAEGSADPAHPRCAAHLHCPPLAVATAADLAVSALNPSLDSWDQAPASSELEALVTRALAREVYPELSKGAEPCRHPAPQRGATSHPAPTADDARNPPHPDARPSARPEARNPLHPDARPSARPEARSPLHPDARPSARPEARSPLHPDARPSAHPEARNPPHPDARPSARPEARNPLHPDAPPSAHPDAPNPPHPDALVTTGGTESNHLALLLARETLGPTVRLLCGSNAHHSLTRAAWLLGLPEPVVVPAPAGTLDPAALDAALTAVPGPHLVAATAGTTDAGLIDPLPDIAARCAAHGARLHIDAAYGGGLLFSDRHRPLLAGLDAAHTVTLDLHKLGWQPVAAGLLAVRDPADLTALHQHADYLNADDDTEAGLPDLLGRSLRTTRRPDVLKIAVTLRTLGRHGLGALVDQVCDHARTFAALVRDHPGLELHAPPTISTVLFRPTGAPDTAVAEIRRRLLTDGHAVLGRARLDGRLWLKATLLNPHTSPHELAALLKTASETGP